MTSLGGLEEHWSVSVGSRNCADEWSGSRYEFYPGPFFFFDVRRTLPYFYVRGREFLFRRLGTRFRHTMVAGGFGPYHRLWRGGTQTKRIGTIHSPLTMGEPNLPGGVDATTVLPSS